MIIKEKRFGQFLEALCITEYRALANSVSLNSFHSEKIVEDCLRSWLSDCGHLKSELIEEYDLCEETSSFILKEIEKLLSQEKVISKLKNNIDFLDFGFDLDKQLLSAYSICCDGINNLIADPEYFNQAENFDRIGEKNIELPREHLRPGIEFGMIWLSKLQSAILNNINLSAGTHIDLENNARLGETLNTISNEFLND